MNINDKPKIGRPEGSTKTKKSLTIDDDILAAASKMVKGKQFASLSALVESAVRELIAKELAQTPQNGGGCDQKGEPFDPPNTGRYVNQPFSDRQKRPQKRP